MCERCICARHLTKIYKNRKKETVAVRDLSLRIPRGEITGLLGVNGAGKTTTIRMLSSVIAPTFGTLTLDGLNAVKYHRQVKARINVISGGERSLYWRLTARENLRYFASLYGLRGRQRRERIDELLSLVGLTDAADTPVERYSKGMKQRLQIARGLVNRPEYLFLDEPTLGLDIVIAQEIRELTMRLARESETGILLTTHYIREAEELCNRIYVIHHGEIAAQGTREELSARFREPDLETILLDILKENDIEAERRTRK